MERTDGDGRKIDDSYVLSVSLAHVDAPSSKDGGGGEGANNDEMGTDCGTDGANVTGDDGVTEDEVTEVTEEGVTGKRGMDR